LKLRYVTVASASGAGAVTNCVSVGSAIAGLTDFTNAAALFGRFCIIHAKATILPCAGYTIALPSYREALALGYFNDQSGAVNPTTLT